MQPPFGKRSGRLWLSAVAGRLAVQLPYTPTPPPQNTTNHQVKHPKVTHLPFTPHQTPQTTPNNQVKNNLLAPVLALFVANGPHTPNLVHSAVIELLDFIRVVRRLIDFCVYGFSPSLLSSYVQHIFHIITPRHHSPLFRPITPTHHHTTPLPSPYQPPTPQTNSPTNQSLTPSSTPHTNPQHPKPTNQLLISSQEHLRELVEYLVEKFRDQVTELGACFGAVLVFVCMYMCAPEGKEGGERGGGVVRVIGLGACLTQEVAALVLLWCLYVGVAFVFVCTK